MKILLHSSVPFSLAHGGAQIQIEQTKAALDEIGVDNEYLRWWDAGQKADIIHFIGRMPLDQVRMAQEKGIRVVMADLLTGQGSRPAWMHRLHGLGLKMADKVLPGAFAGLVASKVYGRADAVLALTPWEAALMERVYGAPRERISVVPNGVEKIFFEEPAVPRGPWLVCTATIAERKRVVEVAKAAIRAETPLWIIGKPYSEGDPYYRAFLEVAGKAPQWVRYEGPIGDRARLAQIYRQARGFVLLSTMESLSLSALEAAACECPLLLSDLPWARCSFETGASYCPIASPEVTARHLRQFYDAAPSLPAPAKPLTWVDVARRLEGIYRRTLSTSR